MRLLVNGKEGNSLGIFMAGGGVLACELMGDNGEAVDITAGATTLEIYDTEDRRNAVKLSATITPVTGLEPAGRGNCTLTDANMVNTVFVAGQRYYGYGKRVVTSDATYANVPVYINIK